MYVKTKIQFYTKQISLVMILIFLNACSKSFVVVSNIPIPLIERSPILAKVRFSDEFKSYKYIEKSSKRALESVDFGQAQTNLFIQVFNSLFTFVDEKHHHQDINIEPTILEFQYSVPSETKSTQYEVWLKYRIRVTDTHDEEIADWVVKGYGKSPDSLMASHLKLFNSASNIALRDVGAQLAIGFRKQSSIEDFLVKLRTPNKAQTTDFGETIDQSEITNKVIEEEKL